MDLMLKLIADQRIDTPPRRLRLTLLEGGVPAAEAVDCILNAPVEPGTAIASVGRSSRQECSPETRRAPLEDAALSEVSGGRIPSRALLIEADGELSCMALKRNFSLLAESGGKRGTAPLMLLTCHNTEAGRFLIDLEPLSYML